MAIKTKLVTVDLVLQYKALKSVMDSKGYQSMKVMTDKQETLSSCTKRKKIQRVQWKTSNNFAWFVSKGNDKSKSEKATKEKKRLKLTVPVLICTSVKLNQVIIMCVVTFKIRHKVLNTVLRNWAMFGNCSQ